jgi:hypothetical protein
MHEKFMENAFYAGLCALDKIEGTFPADISRGSQARFPRKASSAADRSRKIQADLRKK